MDYYFTSKEHDIKFGATFVSDGVSRWDKGASRARADKTISLQKKFEVLVKPAKLDCHTTPEKDTLEVFTGGEMILCWDNSYSYWTGTRLFWHASPLWF